MLRLVLVGVVSLTLLSPLPASFGRKDTSEVRKYLALETLRPVAVSASNEEFRMTATTEVLLDGRPCRYSEVPEGATIILLELASNESKEITRLHFQKAPVKPATTPLSGQ